MTNPKPPLQPGDRVRLIGHSVMGKLVEGCKGTVNDLAPTNSVEPGCIEVSLDNSGDVLVTRSQCIRLKKKQPEVKPEQPRRQKWMNVHDRGEFFLDSEGEAGKWKNTAEFIRTVHLQEIREGESICPPGSVPVSREALAKAFSAIDRLYGNDRATPEVEEWFVNFCKALNLPETK